MARHLLIDILFVPFQSSIQRCNDTTLANCRLQSVYSRIHRETVHVVDGFMRIYQYSKAVLFGSSSIDRMKIHKIIQPCLLRCIYVYIRILRVKSARNWTYLWISLRKMHFKFDQMYQMRLQFKLLSKVISTNARGLSKRMTTYNGYQTMLFDDCN